MKTIASQFNNCFIPAVEKSLQFQSDDSVGLVYKYNLKNDYLDLLKNFENSLNFTQEVIQCNFISFLN
jgi:hypothetical protein